MNNFKQILKDRRGQSAVEMAIMLPILLFILLAIVNIGLYMHAHLEVAFAVQQGVRIGVLTNENSKINGAVNNSLQNLRDYATRTNVVIEPANESSRHRGDDLKVTVIYSYPMPVRFRMPFGITNDFFDKDSMLVKSVAVARMEYE
jgi:Flp pilus assembly protein TadG